MTKLRIGYFEDFRWDNTLLVDGDQEGMAKFAKVLQALASGEVQRIALHSPPFVESHRNVQLVARCTAEDVGLLAADGEFHWHRTRAGWDDAAEKVSSLVKNGGHHYLDARNDEVTVMVTSGEYGPELWANSG